MFTNFLLEIRLASRLIMRKPLTAGDSLLAGILYARYRDPDRAISEVDEMIARVHGVPQMSVMLPYSLASQTVAPITFIRNIMRDMEQDPDMATILNKMPSRSDLTPSQGPLGNFSSTYMTYDIPKVYFIGCGDIDRIEQVMGDCGFIGPQKNRGLGQVAGISIHEVPSDNPWFGMVGNHRGKNIILRPIPLRLRDQLPADLSYDESEETWQNPYFPHFETSIVEPCMVPMFMAGDAFYDQRIEQELSALVPAQP